MMQQQSPLQAEFGHLARYNVDVREIVDHARNIVALSRPIVTVLAGVKGLIRWEYGAHITCAILFIINGCTLFLPAGFSIACVIMSIVGVGAVGMCHRRYRLLSKVFPRSTRSTADDDLTSQERIQEFRLV